MANNQARKLAAKWAAKWAAKKRKKKPTPRDTGARDLAEGKLHGGGGAGAHHTRDRDVAKGRSRKKKHKKDDRAREAGVNFNTVDEALIERAARILQNVGERDAIRKLAESGVPESDAYLAVKAGVILNRGRRAGYKGNPGGKDIYPNEIDHGYGEPLAGGTDVMRKLQNTYVHEQGDVIPQRPKSPRLAASVTEFHRAVAHAWAKLGWYPVRHRNGLEALWNEMFTTLPPDRIHYGNRDEMWGKGVLKKLLAANRDLDSGKMLPPVKGVRLLHSVLKGDIPTILDQILRGGMKAQAQGLGKYSEDPNALFFVEGSTNKRYSSGGAFVVVDIPENWEGWSGAVGARWDWKAEKLQSAPSPEAVVALYHPIPAKYIVAINGLPTAEFKKALKRKEAPMGKAAARYLVDNPALAESVQRLGVRWLSEE